MAALAPSPYGGGGPWVTLACRPHPPWAQCLHNVACYPHCLCYPSYLCYIGVENGWGRDYFFPIQCWWQFNWPQVSCEELILWLAFLLATPWSVRLSVPSVSAESERKKNGWYKVLKKMRKTKEGKGRGKEEEKERGGGAYSLHH